MNPLWESIACNNNREREGEEEKEKERKEKKDMFVNFTQQKKYTSGNLMIYTQMENSIKFMPKITVLEI